MGKIKVVSSEGATNNLTMIVCNHYYYSSGYEIAMGIKSSEPQLNNLLDMKEQLDKIIEKTELKVVKKEPEREPESDGESRVEEPAHVTRLRAEVCDLLSQKTKDQQAVLNAPFDIETHKETFVGYLEVCIDRDGVIHYATPSHQKWLIAEFMRQNNIEDERAAWDMIPIDEGSVGDLCRLTGCVAVWGHFRSTDVIGTFNARQKMAMRRLCIAGLVSANGIGCTRWSE